jgi:hypothetical protein
VATFNKVFLPRSIKQVQLTAEHRLPGQKPAVYRFRKYPGFWKKSPD